MNLGIETTALPDGRSLELEVIRHPGGAAVVALDAEGRVCLLRQLRHAAGGWLWEVPAGKREAEEEPFQTASRELEEEGGVLASVWTNLGSILTTPGFCDEEIHLFLATGLRPVATRHGEEEWIEVHWEPFDWALEQARSGEIRDAKTVAALFRAREALGSERGDL